MEIPTPRTNRIPMRIPHFHLLANTSDTNSAKILFNALQVGIRTVDHSAFCGRNDQRIPRVSPGVAP
jgi:hypothetical protein